MSNNVEVVEIPLESLTAALKAAGILPVSAELDAAVADGAVRWSGEPFVPQTLMLRFRDASFAEVPEHHATPTRVTSCTAVSPVSVLRQCSPAVADRLNPLEEVA